MKIKCNRLNCEEPAVIMVKCKNSGKYFYCIEHYIKKKKKEERKNGK